MKIGFKYLRPRVHPRHGPQHGYTVTLRWRLHFFHIELDHDHDIILTYSDRNKTVGAIGVKVIYTSRIFHPFRKHKVEEL